MIKIADVLIQRGYRTAAAHYTETTYGLFNLTSTQCYRVGGKVKGVNWQTRQNIIQTGNVGQGRNYTQQLLGAYDANASVNFEISDLSFFRYALGDVAKQGSGNAEATPYYIVDSELYGTDSAGGLTGAPTTHTGIRVRPFSMLLYDLEQASGGSSLHDSVDILTGCAINDFNISASVGTVLQASVNLVVKEVMHKVNLGALNPVFTGTSAMTDSGLGEPISSGASQSYADSPPYMFYGGSIIVDGNVLGQVTSFNYAFNNSLITYRAIGNRFIEMPQLGMRRQSLTVNAVLKVDNAASLYEGTPTGGATNVLELIKNYFGYASTQSVAATTVMRPAQASAQTLASSQLAGTTALAAGPSIVVPITKSKIDLKFSGSTAGMLNATGGTTLSASTKYAKVTVRNAVVEGFGVPVQLENGLIEVPITFNVKGQAYGRTSDGSFSGYVSSGGDVQTNTYNPTMSWWYA